MVHLELAAAELTPFLQHMRDAGILVERSRWVFHRDISAADETQILAAIHNYGH